MLVAEIKASGILSLYSRLISAVLMMIGESIPNDISVTQEFMIHLHIGLQLGEVAETKAQVFSLVQLFIRNPNAMSFS